MRSVLVKLALGAALLVLICACETARPSVHAPDPIAVAEARGKPWATRWSFQAETAAQGTPALSYYSDVEPPLVIDLAVLADGTIVLLRPLAFEERSVKAFRFNQKGYDYLSTQVEIIALDPESGRVKWRQTVPTRGLCRLIPLGAVLLLDAEEYTDGIRVSSSLAALSSAAGKVLWTRSFSPRLSYVTPLAAEGLLLVSRFHKDSFEGGYSTEALRLEDGTLLWTSSSETPQRSYAAPITLPGRLILFETGAACRAPDTGRIIWERRDLSGRRLAVAGWDRSQLFVLEGKGLAALSTENGAELWRVEVVEGSAASAAVSGDRVYLWLEKTAQQEEEKTAGKKVKPMAFRRQFDRNEHPVFAPDQKTSLLLALQRTTGSILWKLEVPEPLLGSPTEIEGSLYATTPTRLLRIEAVSGALRQERELPWKDRIATHDIGQVGNTVVVASEWDVAAWRLEGTEPVYVHHFQPVWPVVTTAERVYDERLARWIVENVGQKKGLLSWFRVGGRSVQSQGLSYGASASYESSMRQARYYASRGDMSSSMLYSSMADTTADMDRASQGMASAINTMIGGFVAANQAEMERLTGVISCHLLAYPHLDAELGRVRSLSRGLVEARLVQTEHKGQRFVALEALDLQTGKASRQLLSPLQSVAKCATLASEPNMVSTFSNYLRLVSVLYHNLRTAVDWDKGVIYHYGPGLDPASYAYIKSKDFVSGRLWALPLALSPLEPVQK